ncbi:MAG: hypothetical protein PVG48_00695 [Candidatus Bathyarchaeota archaeon]
MAKSKKKNQLKPTETIGKKVLILGEVGSGKTSLTAKAVQELMLFIEPKEITVIDMAPEAIGEIGGKLSKYLSLNNELRCLSPAKVYAPRTMGITNKQVAEYAKRNKNSIEPLLDEFLKQPTKVLIINDITLYLHLGKLEKIINCIRSTETFLASAYYGVRLKEDYGAGISAREKQMVDKLATYMDHVVKLNGSA